LAFRAGIDARPHIAIAAKNAAAGNLLLSGLFTT
jgi:hypothetical protein